MFAAFCFNRSGRIKEKTLHIADIQGFPEFGQISARPHFLTQRAENGTRTRDLNLGKVALYQLSYFRKWCFAIASAKVDKKSESPNFTLKKTEKLQFLL